MPKVIDFGTAKATERLWTDRAGLTEQGTMVGTLEYMSPEQAALSADIDTTTDVYSLGVLLYELLVGELPFDRQTRGAAGDDEMRRVIRETDAPRPSDRLAGRGQAASGIADSRHTDIGPLTRELRGDLDWITLRALEKDRRRRYPTVAAFAADIERSLADEPVEARPPTARYRLGKFARRYRGAVAAAAALLVVLLAGLATSTVQYLRAERARVDAERQRVQADTLRTVAEAQRTIALTQQRAADRSTAEAIAANGAADRQRVLATNAAAAAGAALLEAEYRTYAATIVAADGELRANAPLAARERLLTVPVARRDWEWHHLSLRTDSSLFTLAPATVCAPSGTTVTTSDNVFVLGAQGKQIFRRRCGTLDTWDASTFAHTADRTPRNHTILAVNAADRMLVLPRLAQGPWGLQLVRRNSNLPTVTLGPFETRLDCADVSPDGTRVAVGLRPARSPIGEQLDDAFEIWNGESSRRVSRMVPARPLLDTRLANACMVRFSPDGTRVATSGATVQVWATESGAAVMADATQAGYASQPIAFSPDGTRLAVGRLNGLVDVLNLTATTSPIDHLDGNGFVQPLPMAEGERRILTSLRRANEVRSVTFSPDGARIISGTDTNVGIWDLARAKLVTVLAGHDAAVNGVLVSSDGRLIFSSDAAGTVRVWPSGASAGVDRLEGSSAHAVDIALGADGTAIGAAGTDGSLTAWRLADMRPLIVRAGSGKLDIRNLARSLAMSPDGRQLLSGESDAVGTVRVWTVGSGESLAMPMRASVEPGCETPTPNPTPNTNRPVSLMALSRDGRVLAFQHGICVVVRELPTRKTLAAFRLPEPERVSALVFRPDGVLVMALRLPLAADASTQTAVRLWDWRTDRVLAAVVTRGLGVGSRGAIGLTIAADGSRVAVFNGTLSMWDGNLSRELGRLPARDIEKAAFSPNGRRIVTANKDTAVRVWDADRLLPLLTLTDTDGHTGGVAFTPDGRIIAGRSSGGLTIWESQSPHARRRVPDRRP